MNKREFIEKLREKLSKFPQKEVEDRISFYSEMIDDKIEDGVLEQEAVAQLGDVDKVAAQIASEIPLTKIIKEKVKPNRKLEIWEIVLLIVGSPVWFSVLAGVLAGVVSAYAAIWAGVAALWAGFATVCAVAGYGVVAGGIMMITADMATNLIIFGLGIAGVGFAIFFYFGCWYATKGLIILTKKIILAIKNSFIKKEIQ